MVSANPQGKLFVVMNRSMFQITNFVVRPLVAASLQQYRQAHLFNQHPHQEQRIPMMNQELDGFIQGWPPVGDQAEKPTSIFRLAPVTKAASGLAR